MLCVSNRVPVPLLTPQRTSTTRTTLPKHFNIEPMFVMSMLARCSARVHACSASASRNLASATSMDEEEELKVESALEVLGLGVVCSGLLPTTADMAVKCWSVRALLSAGDSGSPLDKVASMPDDSNGSGVQPVGSIVHRGACQRTMADNLCFG